MIALQISIFFIIFKDIQIYDLITQPFNRMHLSLIKKENKQQSGFINEIWVTFSHTECSQNSNFKAEYGLLSCFTFSHPSVQHAFGVLF